jgi:IMP dehydrogenase
MPGEAGFAASTPLSHNLVMDNGTPKGIFTERDLVKEHVGVLTKELHYLRDYISDLEDASYD